MANNTIITIGRQYGSGGHDIGKQLAEELNIPFYDKALLERAAKDSGLCQEIFENHDEKPTNSFLYSLVMDTYSLGYTTSSFSLFDDRSRPPKPVQPRTTRFCRIRTG